MVHCVAFGCTNKSDKKKKTDKVIHFFSFPKDIKLRSTWITLMKREGYVWKETHKLCSDHFLRSEYEVDPEFMRQYGYDKAKPKLKKTAVPFFNFNPYQSPSMTPSRGAYTKRRKLEILDDAFQSYNEKMILEDVTNHHVDLDVPVTVLVDDSKENTTLNRSTATQVNPLTLPKSTQVSIRPTTCSKVISCDLANLGPLSHNKQGRKECSSQTENSTSSGLDTDNHAHIDGNNELDETFNEPSFEFIDNETEDPSYFPNTEDVEEAEIEVDVEEKLPPHRERKYIVFHSNLLELFQTCTQSNCFSQCVQKQLRIVGTMVVVTVKCKSGHIYVWRSQPMHKALPLGNICVAAALLFSGNSFKKTETLLNNMQVPFISESTFYQIQKAYLIPVVLHYWQQKQEVHLSQLTNEEIIAGGDGRCDSPGFCAKYGSYTLMDLERNKVLDIQLVQSNEVAGSTHMELEGLKRALASLEEKGISIVRVVTDRHVQVKKYMREEKPNIRHDHDVWHMANGIDKKLSTAAKRKNGIEIKPWIPSIKNHMYWTATTSGDDGPLKRAKWLSILNHIADIHEGHSDIFPECAHGQLEPRQWIRKGSIPYKLMEPIIRSPYLLKDIEKLSPLYQTYGLEVFHRVILSFAPKNLHFFYLSMKARTYLAALHYNENSENNQAVTKDGAARFTPVYPKRSKGEVVVVKPVKEKPTFGYAMDLMEAVLERRKNFPTYRQAMEDGQDIQAEKPPPLTSSYRPYDKNELIANRVSRFPQPV